MDLKLHRENGVYVATVLDIVDPLGLGRILVEVPTLKIGSAWARLVQPMAGHQRGTFFRPEIGEEVVIAFEQGEPRRPLVLGGIWNKVDPPPPDDGRQSENNWRFITSRSGHVIKLDDTRGGERIEVVDKDGQRRLVIDSAGSKIQVVCDRGDIEIRAPAGSVKVEAAQVEIAATGSMKLSAGGVMTIRGATVNIN